MVDLAHSEIYRNIPIGDKVAREFPWFLEGTVVLPAGVAYRQSRFSVGAPATYYRSDREGPIKVREIRMILDDTGERITSGELATTVQIKHSKYDVMDRWVPTLCLNTEDDRHFWGDTASARVKLEYPYFLQRGEAFRIDLVPLTALIDSEVIDVCLRGWDPYNQCSRVMNKQVTLPAANNLVTATFDENRDAAVYSMWVHDITFGFTDVNGPATPRSITDNLRVRFKTSQGPKWTDEDPIGTRLSGLVHDDSCLTPGAAYRPTMIHRPVKPYILNPREVLTVQVRNEAQTATQNTWWCWVIGTQKGRYR